MTPVSECTRPSPRQCPISRSPLLGTLLQSSQARNYDVQLPFAIRHRTRRARSMGAHPFSHELLQQRQRLEPGARNIAHILEQEDLRLCLRMQGRNRVTGRQSRSLLRPPLACRASQTLRQNSMPDADRRLQRTRTNDPFRSFPTARWKMGQEKEIQQGSLPLRGGVPIHGQPVITDRQIARV